MRFNKGKKRWFALYCKSFNNWQHIVIIFQDQERPRKIQFDELSDDMIIHLITKLCSDKLGRGLQSS